jgi:hypothetical protein
MKVVERRNNEIIEIGKIESIDGLDNSVLILLERGDKIKKAIKGGRTMFGNKNLMSVKSMREAMDENARKQSKKNKTEGGLCCVCTDWFPNSMLDSRGVCSHCQIS